MDLSNFVRRGRKALGMPPAVLMARLAEELRTQTRRPWAKLYPRMLGDRAVLGSGAASYDALWQRQMSARFFVNPSDRDGYAQAFRARYPDEIAAVIATADAALRHEFDLLGSGVKALGSKLP